jgi:pimeloyl-ACP methyl ester carboxylesterase
LHIPVAQQHVVEAGHFLQEDRPAEVAHLLVQFMHRV